MSTTATLDSASVQMAAGEEVVVPLQIRNNGEIVEGYRIEVVGAPAGWAAVEPATISLYPGTSTTATVTFRPPRSFDVPAGEQQFGVVVTPTEHPDEAVVPEGVVEVLPFLDTVAELVPRTSQGRRRGRHQVAVDNRGNVGVTAVLDAADDGQRLRFRISPPAVTVGPGEARFVDVRTRPVRRVWRGAPVTHPFVVSVAPQDSTPVELPGTYLQQPMIPKWLPRALLALLAVLLLLAALWFLLLKPTIESQAKEAAEEAVADDAAAAAEDAAAAQQAAGAAGAAAKDAGQAADTATELVGEPRAPRTVVVPVSERLSVVSAGTARDEFLVPEGGTLEITDMVLSNPQGDFGRVTLSLGDEVLFESALENFRDLDYHFVTPLTATDEEVLTLEVVCRRPGRPPAAPRPETCDIASFIGGTMTLPAPQPAPEPASAP